MVELEEEGVGLGAESGDWGGVTKQFTPIACCKAKRKQWSGGEEGSGKECCSTQFLDGQGQYYIHVCMHQFVQFPLSIVAMVTIASSN